ncbi:MAG TPA: glutamate-1-semialdehyde 2,1-aminomutase [Candidatus Sulfotelmatobacter sp.]|nr:glutamate-1-semialdehyde 2,1-aminomutase [Candidatus Sulfotelmatobacter sp.]
MPVFQSIETAKNPTTSVKARYRMNFAKSKALQKRFHSTIPGGAHTYAKGDDQYPEQMPVYIVRGKGSHVWDMDGNEFIEYGMGLRSVTLGHAYDSVVQAACRQIQSGNNFVRPCPIELECAEAFQGFIGAAEMVKFGKHGSDATSAAVKLARAFTGRDLIAICREHPFFSVDDWFIGSTPMNAGIPEVIRKLTLKFRYNDLNSVRELFAAHSSRIAAVILEAEREQEPAPGFLQGLKELCAKEGAVLVFDESITGFRWANGGAQQFHKVTPDLSTFGKGLANGFSVSALAGRRGIMRLGGLDHDRERVFLLSTTHGAEHHALAAAIETMRIYRDEPVVDTLWRQGGLLRDGIHQVVNELKLQNHFLLNGRPCCLMYATLDQKREPSQAFRTLFLQETMRRGLLMPSLVISYSHSDQDIQRTIDGIAGALGVYRRAIDEGIDRYLEGRPVKPVFREFN